MKVKFIAPSKTSEFKEGQILNANYPADGNRGMIVIVNKSGEHYGYPANWFAILEEPEARRPT